MRKLVLKYIGMDDWDRAVYKDRNGRLFKDTDCIDNSLTHHSVCTVSGDFEGEPDTPLIYIDKYKDVEIEVLSEGVPNKAEKHNYMMLDRLKQDCDYFLGNGGRHEKHLWAGDVEGQIKEMKRLYHSFSDDKKPEWLTLDDILEYEEKMLNILE